MPGVIPCWGVQPSLYRVDVLEHLFCVGLSQTARVAITKHHRLEACIVEIYFLTFFSWRLEVWGKGAGMVSFWWRLSSWLGGHFFSVSSRGRMKKSKIFGFFSRKDTNPIMGALPPLPWIHLNLITSQGSHLQILSHWGLGLWHVHFVAGTFQELHQAWSIQGEVRHRHSP